MTRRVWRRSWSSSLEALGRPVIRGLLLPLAPLTLLWVGWERRWVAEDAFIDLRVARLLLAGHGPVFNAGERVEVYTSPLWVALLTILAAPLARLRPLLQVDVPLEWIAALTGLLFAVAGLLAAECGALHLARAAGDGGFALPLGAIAVVAIPAYWDFATSGLETGLALGWLGLTFWALAVAGERRKTKNQAQICPSSFVFRPPSFVLRPSSSARWLAVLAGFGPLIRPDLAIFSAGFYLALLGFTLPARPGQRLWEAAVLLAAAGALPVAYQVFRMGYFATLVPNTALAKEAGMAYWVQGWRYLADFALPYALWIPLVELLAWCCLVAGRLVSRPAWPAVLLVVAMLASSLLHALYVARVGGDFMHGRLLLPSYFAAVLPVAVVAGTRWWQPLIPGLIVVPWAIVCALWLRPPYFHAGPEPPKSIGPQGIADERGFYVRYSGRGNPITLEDYADSGWAQDGHALRRLAGQRRTLLPWESGVLLGGGTGGDASEGLPLAPEVVSSVVAARNNVGLTGYGAGLDVHVVDRRGLGDPMASRLSLPHRGRPGHEKALPDDWVIARFGAIVGPARPDVEAARAALRCGDLAELIGAIEAPLTIDRFWHNIALSWRLTQLRLPADPVAAQAELCRT